MLKSDAIDYFGSGANLAEVLGLSRQAVYLWGDLIPEQWAWMIEGKTRGALKVNPRLYESAA